MADDVRVSCATRIKRYDSHAGVHRRLLYIGGIGVSGIPWKLSEASAIAGIESGRWNFFVREGSRVAPIVIASRNGEKYLRTTSDEDSSNNLLSLPECP